MPFYHRPSICPYVICLPYALYVIKLPSYGFYHMPFKEISRRIWQCYNYGPFAMSKGTTHELWIKRGGGKRKVARPEQFLYLPVLFLSAWAMNGQKCPVFLVFHYCSLPSFYSVKPVNSWRDSNCFSENISNGM